MNKSVLAVLCLLAFVAGGAAQLVLHRASGTSGTAESVVQTPAGVAPQPSEKADAAPAQAGGVTAAPGLEAQAPDANAPADSSGPNNAPLEARADDLVLSESISEESPARPRRVAYRHVGARSQAARSAPPAPRSTRSYHNDDAPHEKAASGAKKTGRWLGKGLKKIGGVFHD